MGRFLDISRKKFNRLYVIEKAGITTNGNIKWLCLCDCGNKKIINGYFIRKGIIKSCGCLKKEKSKENGMKNIKHGHNRIIEKTSITYRSWSAMKARCKNPNNNRYKQYNERNIKIYRRWLKFENFLEDMGERPSKQYSLDRINNNGNYCKSNCRWATSKEQSRNRNNNTKIEYNGQVKSIAEWAEIYNIKQQTLRHRIFKSNWNIKKSLETPVRRRCGKNHM